MHAFRKTLWPAVHRRICEILVALLALFFFGTKNLHDPYDQVIMAEGLGYYAYLPAVFIYDDLSFSFFNEVHDRYYATGYSPPTANFVLEFDGLRLNKYFPGVSLLWLPFFLVAHLLALLFHLPADGYSPVYQLAIGCAGLFYTWLGLRFTKKMMDTHRIGPSQQSLALAGILFATNLTLYAGSWSAQTHCYSFAIIAAAGWLLMRLFDPEEPDKRRLPGILFILLALLVTLRPQDLILLLLLPFFGWTMPAFRQVVRRYLFTRQTLAGLLVACLVAGRVCLFWYLQTGKFVLQPYHGEGYIWNQPHLADYLFSYRKGWLLYTPFAALALAGIFFTGSRRSSASLLVFWLAVVYANSCWWCWTFSPSSFGQRPMVDFYSILALQAAFLFRFMSRHRMSVVAVMVTAVLAGLNLLQTYQYRHGIIPGEFASAETYWPHFFTVHPVAYYPVPPATMLQRAVAGAPQDGESDTTAVSSSQPFSRTLRLPLPAFLTPGNHSHMRFSAEVMSSKLAAPHESVVIDFRRGDSTVSYQSFGLRDFVRSSRWQPLQFGMEIPANVSLTDTVLVYLWRSDPTLNVTTRMRSMRVEFIRTDDSFDFHRIGE